MKKVALVYDRVNKWGGAERVLLALHEIFPDAPLYTAVANLEKAKWARVFPKVIPSFLQKIPFAKDNHEFLGFLTPMAFESFNFDEFDLVISVTSEASKGIITKPKTLHICYCLTPTRYLWSGYKEYLNSPPSKFARIPFFSFFAKPLLSYVKYWDKVASKRPDYYLTISGAVKDRVKRYYNRESKIVYPPVEIDKFSDYSEDRAKDNFYLFVSRLIPYKKADLAIEAFNKLGLNLVVVGTGSEKSKLVKKAGRTIKFIDYLSDDDLAAYYRKAKALIFPGEEDFGIVMVESIASGTPVVAYHKGGAADIVKDGLNGVSFYNQSVKDIVSAVKRLEKLKFSKSIMLKSVQRFSKPRFQKEITDFVEKHKTFL